MSATLPKLMTAEEFWNSPLNGKGVELVRGEVETTMPTGGRHGAVQVKLGGRLDRWATANNTGWVGSETGFILAHDPDVVRGPDIAFVRRERFEATGLPNGFWPIAPDVAVEVVSPSEFAEQVQAKVHDYLSAGTQEVWVIYPNTREVVIHLPDGAARTVKADQPLTSEVLPGFSCILAELFAV